MPLEVKSGHARSTMRTSWRLRDCVVPGGAKSARKTTRGATL
jgi:hypothetical protein